MPLLKLINSDAPWVRWTTYAVSLLLGAAAWELAGRNANAVFMAPLIGDVQIPGAARRLLEFAGDSHFHEALLSSLKLFATGF